VTEIGEHTRLGCGGTRPAFRVLRATEAPILGHGFLNVFSSRSFRSSSFVVLSFMERVADEGGRVRVEGEKPTIRRWMLNG